MKVSQGEYIGDALYVVPCMMLYVTCYVDCTYLDCQGEATPYAGWGKGGMNNHLLQTRIA